MTVWVCFFSVSKSCCLLQSQSLQCLTGIRALCSEGLREVSAGSTCSQSPFSVTACSVVRCTSAALEGFQQSATAQPSPLVPHCDLAGVSRALVSVCLGPYAGGSTKSCPREELQRSERLRFLVVLAAAFGFELSFLPLLKGVFVFCAFCDKLLLCWYL